MTRRAVATGAAAERARLEAADVDGVPWRAWSPSPDDGSGGLPSLHDTLSGLRFSIAMTSGRPLEDVRYLLATPTASFVLASAVVPAPGDDGPAPRLVMRYAKRSPEDIVVRIAVHNPGPTLAAVYLSATLAFPDSTDVPADGQLASVRAPWESTGPLLDRDTRLLRAQHAEYGTWWLTTHTERLTVTSEEAGASATFRYALCLAAGETRTVSLRLGRGDDPRPPVGVDAEATLGTRAREASAFVDDLLPRGASADQRATSRIALATLLLAPPSATQGAVEATFGALACALVDPVGAQQRLAALIEARRSADPSTEPPVAPWAALRIHELLVSGTGRRDHDFLERVFHDLLEDYSHWVDRLDGSDRNLLQGGLLDLDGPGSSAAGAAWMGCYSVWMLSLAIELARDDASYQDVAVTFLESMLAMVTSLDDLGGSGTGMWDAGDEWHHDVARGRDGDVHRLPGRTAIGVVPLLAVAVIPREALVRLPEVSVRLGWSLRHDQDPAGSVVRAPRQQGARGDVLVSLVPEERRSAALDVLGLLDGELSAAMACLLLDVIDRLAAFGADMPAVDVAGRAPDLSAIADDLMSRLTSETPGPVWATLLTGAMGRSR